MLPVEPEDDADSSDRRVDPNERSRAGRARNPGRSERAVRIESEREAPGGWSFIVHIDSPDAEPTSHELTLSWPDYEFWSHGLIPPSRIAEAVVRGTLQLAPDFRPPARLDASTCRRRAGGRALDEWVRANV